MKRLTVFSGRRALLAAALGLCSATAWAGPQCTREPESKWMDAAKFQAQLKQQGYIVAKFKTTAGHCYEIYGKDKTGAKVEIYFDPVHGKIVKEERH